MRISFFICWLFIFSAQAIELDVVTYNTGLLKIVGKDFVPCVEGRQKALIPAIRKQFSSNPSHFILALQEVWSPEDQKKLSKMADGQGWSISTASVASRGVINLSDGVLIGQAFTPFSCDTFSIHNKRGILMNRFQFSPGEEVVVYNAHTSYSGFKKPDPCHLQQLKEFSDIKKDIHNSSTPALLMADLNVGANLSYINPKHPQEKIKYSVFEEIWKPFIGPLTAQTNPFEWMEVPLPPDTKTWDGGVNPLVSKSILKWEETPSQLDHIFVSKDWDFAEPPKAHLEFNQVLAIEGCDDHLVTQGSKTGGFLSDHFGVGATLLTK